MVKPPTHPCDACGQPVPQSPGPGRVKRACSPEHRASTTPRVRTQCTGCGTPLTKGGYTRCSTCRAPRPPRPLSTNYRAVHGRLWNARGKASAHPCTGCGQPAEQWAYDHSDPNQITAQWNGKTVTYSLDLGRYDPLCRSCHVRRDGNGYAGSALEQINAQRRSRS